MGAGESSTQPVGEGGPAGAKLHEGQVWLEEAGLAEVSHQRTVLDVMLQHTGTWVGRGRDNKNKVF